MAGNRIIHDRHGLAGLLVQRFAAAGCRWPQAPDGPRGRDTGQGPAPAAKYGLAAEDVVSALARLCIAPVVAGGNLYLQFAFARLAGNDDLHAKNLSVLGRQGGGFEIAPLCDLPCTLLYGDETMALPIAGKLKNLKARHWTEFADALGLPPRAAASVDLAALRQLRAVPRRRCSCGSAIPWASSRRSWEPPPISWPPKRCTTPSSMQGPGMSPSGWGGKVNQSA